MLHSTREEVESSMRLAIQGQPEDAWILDRIRERAVILSQGDDEEVRNAKISELLDKKERIITLDFQGVYEVDAQNDSSIVANDHIMLPDKRVLPVIRVARRPCDRFWFGLKLAVEVLLFERTFDYGEMKVETLRRISALTPTKRETRPQLAEFFRQSRERLEAHIAETRVMLPSLVFRSVNRELEGALNRVIPQIRSHCTIVSEQKLLVTMLAHEVMQITQECFPPPLSVEEEAARSILLALASSHAAHAALAPSVQN